VQKMASKALNSRVDSHQPTIVVHAAALAAPAAGTQQHLAWFQQASNRLQQALQGFRPVQGVKTGVQLHIAILSPAVSTAQKQYEALRSLFVTRCPALVRGMLWVVDVTGSNSDGVAQLGSSLASTTRSTCVGWTAGGLEAGGHSQQGQ